MSKAERFISAFLETIAEVGLIYMIVVGRDIQFEDIISIPALIIFIFNFIRWWFA